MSLPLIPVPSGYTGYKECFCGDEEVSAHNPLLTHPRVRIEDTESRFHVAHRSCWRGWALAKNNGIVTCPECPAQVDVRSHLSDTVLADTWSKKAKTVCKYALFAGTALTAIAAINSPTFQTLSQDVKTIAQDTDSFMKNAQLRVVEQLESVIGNDIAHIAGAAIAGILGAGIVIPKIVVSGIVETARSTPFAIAGTIIKGTVKLCERMAPELQPRKLISIMSIGTLAIFAAQKLMEIQSL